MDIMQKGVPDRARLRLFVDMDGTLAEFRSVDTLETLYEKGYFAELRPQETVVEGIKTFMNENQAAEVFILSSVLTDSPYAAAEKEAWLDRYLPEIDTQHRIFVPCGSPKSAFVPEGIKKSDVLLDDYSQNLHEWQGKGIKLMNGINGTRGSWQGARISADMTAAALCRELGKICKEKAASEPNKQDGGILMYVDGDFKDGKPTLDPEDVKTIKRILDRWDQTYNLQENDFDLIGCMDELIQEKAAAPIEEPAAETEVER